jgi:hypothetical protein
LAEHYDEPRAANPVRTSNRATRSDARAIRIPGLATCGLVDVGLRLAASSREQPRDKGDLFCPTGRFEQPRVARSAGVAPSDSRSIEQLQVAVSSEKQPRAARFYRATVSDKKTH